MNAENMTRKQFMQLPRKKWNEEISCDTLIIVPHDIGKRSAIWYSFRKWLHECVPTLFKEPEIYEVSGIHDSGYRLISCVLCKGDEPFCITDGGDVLHIDGIGGFGYHWFENYHYVPSNIPVAGWTIDCLSRSGLFRLWCSENILVGRSLSSQDIFMIKKEKNENTRQINGR